MKKSPRNNSLSLTVSHLAQLLGCSFEGEGSTVIKGIASLNKAIKGDLVYLEHPKYNDLLEKTSASAAIIPVDKKYGRIPTIQSKNPHLDFIKTVNLFFKPCLPEPGIHPLAFVSSSAKIGKNVSIGAFSYLGEKTEIGEGAVIFPLVSIYPAVKIGKHTIIHSHVSIREEVIIGNHVLIHNGAVIGSDGFGYIQDKDGSSIKIPQKGRVIIEDHVEVGANTAIDRATIDETIIKKGTKIDNLVQIAHNVEIGQQSVLAAQTGIAGSTKIGKNVITGGQAGISDHIKIGDNVIAAARSGIIKDVPPRSIVAGFPHMDIRTWKKSWASMSHLYDLFREVKKLKKKVEELEKKK
ncbi:UDP-3-O-(3-hydroxymyristoyl)glucosamine N-acyltransferase [Acidobacteriota bacterium]